MCTTPSGAIRRSGRSGGATTRRRRPVLAGGVVGIPRAGARGPRATPFPAALLGLRRAVFVHRPPTLEERSGGAAASVNVRQPVFIARYRGRRRLRAHESDDGPRPSRWIVQPSFRGGGDRDRVGCGRMFALDSSGSRSAASVLNVIAGIALIAPAWRSHSTASPSPISWWRSGPRHRLEPRTRGRHC